MTDNPTGLRPRHQLTSITDALADTRVVLIAGPRQAGKSTLAQMALEDQRGMRYANLDEDLTREAARDDPTEFLRHDGAMLIDEIQRVPSLLLSIKAIVDRSRQPGQFLLTGSANVLSIPAVVDALPGRMEIIELWPLSQGEIRGQREDFIDRAFSGWQADGKAEQSLTRTEYLQCATTGGYPEILDRPSESRRSRWFESYINTMLRRDLRDISNIERPDDLRRVLELLAARSANLYNAEDIARAAQIPASTVKRYVALLESAYIVTRVPAWANNRTTRALRARKVFVADSGLLAHLLGTDAPAAAAPGGLAGQLLETFVAMELHRQLGWSTTRARMYHLRNRQGNEVDIVLEAAGGRVVGIEVKAASTVRSDDFRGLRFLRERVGDRMTCGLVLYTGTATHSFGDGMSCVPISDLWQGPPVEAPRLRLHGRRVSGDTN